MQEVATRKVSAADYGLPGRWATVTVLASKVHTKRRVASHGAKRAKRQGSERMGNRPIVRMSNWDATFAKDGQRVRTVADVLGLDLAL